MTRAAFVIGHPISHSRSPLIHRHWLNALQIAGSYEAINILPEGLAEFFGRIRAGEFVGGNVTIPHKEQVLGLCDEVDETARMIGAVNTLVRDGDRLRGLNSDWIGFLANLDEHAPGWDQSPGRAIVLGAGGAARGIVLALARRGFGEVHILNRTPERAVALAQDLASSVTTQLSGAGLEAFDDLAGSAQLLANSSAVGMHDTRFEGIDLTRLPDSAVVTDAVYTPLITPLLADARRRGLRTVDGLGMLLHQAAPGFAAWFGHTPQVTPELRAVIEESLGVS